MNSVVDIDLTLLSHLQFEQLCYDLVEASGFSHIIWRQGGADGGRDVEATRRISNGIVEDYNELWFFECKHHSSGVSLNHLSSKFTNGLAEDPNHLVFFVSTYLTKDALDWTEKMASKARFKIHIVDGQRIKLLLNMHPEITTRYFNNELQLARRAWVLSEARPSLQALIRMADPTMLESYSPFDRALLFYWSQYSARDSRGDGPLWRNWIPLLAPHANTVSPLLQENELEYCEFEQSGYHDAHGLVMTARFAKVPALGNSTGSYCVQLIDDELIEALIEQSDELRVSIRHLTQGGGQEFDRVSSLTDALFWRRRKKLAELGQLSR